MLVSLPSHAHAFAINSNRRVPSTRDFYSALEHSGPRLRQAALEQYLRDVDLDELKWNPEHLPVDDKQEWLNPFHGFLPSESEDDSAAEGDDEVMKDSSVIVTRAKKAVRTTVCKRRRKRFHPEMAEVPSHLPNLPPKHTWISTPSYPAHSMTLQPPLDFLDMKVSSNRLMEVSLRGLIRATDAAVLESQVKRESFPTEEDGKTMELNPGVFAETKGQFDEKSGKVSQPVIPANLVEAETLAEGSENDANRIRLKKGRTLSLRLRTPSTSQAGTSLLSNVQSPDESPAQSSKPKLHRQSMSISGGPQSAIVPSFASPFRRNTFTSGPWSATPNQTPLTWNSTIPSSDMFSPLATPLTAGLSYHYPPTPLEMYTNELSSGDVLDQSENPQRLPVGLPPTVNYKRTWYKKSNHASMLTSQKRLKS